MDKKKEMGWMTQEMSIDESLTPIIQPDRSLRAMWRRNRADIIDLEQHPILHSTSAHTHTHTHVAQSFAVQVGSAKMEGSITFCPFGKSAPLTSRLVVA